VQICDERILFGETVEEDFCAITLAKADPRASINAGVSSADSELKTHRRDMDSREFP